MYKGKLVAYLACPYSHHKEHVMTDRFEAINDAAGILIKEGYIVFSPISHSHPISLTMEPDDKRDQELWLGQDEFFLSRSDVMIVATFPGWEQSAGVAYEIKFAKKYGIPVVYRRFGYF